MTRSPIQLPIRSNRTREGYEGDAALVNMFIENLGRDAKAPFAAYVMPGFSLFTTLSGGGEVRAMLAIDAKLYVVAGRLCYVVDTAGTASIIGGVATDGPVTMERNRREPSAEIGIASDGLYYVIDTGSDTLSLIVNSDLRPVGSIAVLDGFFFLGGLDNRYQITGADDATSIDPLDFAKAESTPEKIVRVIEFNREVWVFKSDAIETWQNVGTSFPFARSSAFGLGCLALGSVAEIDEKLFWVAADGTVRMSDGGYGGIQISNHGVERAIAAEPNQSDISAATWTVDGHHFYNISGSTFSYQFDTANGGDWSQRDSYGLARWRVSKVIRFNGMWIAGDFENGKLYKLSKDTLDEAGADLVGTVHLPPVHAWPHGLIFDRIDIDVVPGVGLNTTVPENLDPVLMLDWSDDGGRSWSTQRHIALGRQGDTDNRVYDTRLGRLERNQRTFRLSISADVKKGIFGASVDAEALAA